MWSCLGWRDITESPQVSRICLFRDKPVWAMEGTTKTHDRDQHSTFGQGSCDSSCLGDDGARLRPHRGDHAAALDQFHACFLWNGTRPALIGWLLCVHHEGSMLTASQRQRSWQRRWPRARNLTDSALLKSLRDPPTPVGCKGFYDCFLFRGSLKVPQQGLLGTFLFFSQETCPRCWGCWKCKGCNQPHTVQEHPIFASNISRLSDTQN